MEKKKFYRILSFVLFGLGSFLILSSEAGITGAVIGVNIDSPVTSFIGFLMILGCVALFMAGLDKKMQGKQEQQPELDLSALLEKALDDAETVEEVHVDVPLSHYTSLTPIKGKYREVDGEEMQVYEAISPDGKRHELTVRIMGITRLDLGSGGQYVTVPTERRIMSESGEPVYEPIDWEREVRDHRELFEEHGVSIDKVIEDLREYRTKPTRRR